MCDYSLHNVASRPARVGDKLTTRDFGTGTRGFAGAEDVRVAVCVLPGTGAGRRSITERQYSGRSTKNAPQRITMPWSFLTGTLSC